MAISFANLLTARTPNPSREAAIYAQMQEMKERQARTDAALAAGELERAKAKAEEQKAKDSLAFKDDLYRQALETQQKLGPVGQTVYVSPDMTGTQLLSAINAMGTMSVKQMEEEKKAEGVSALQTLLEEGTAQGSNPIAPIEEVSRVNYDDAIWGPNMPRGKRPGIGGNQVPFAGNPLLGNEETLAIDEDRQAAMSGPPMGYGKIIEVEAQPGVEGTEPGVYRKVLGDDVVDQIIRMYPDPKEATDVLKSKALAAVTEDPAKLRMFPLDDGTGVIYAGDLTQEQAEAGQIPKAYRGDLGQMLAVGSGAQSEPPQPITPKTPGVVAPVQRSSKRGFDVPGLPGLPPLSDGMTYIDGLPPPGTVTTKPGAAKAKLDAAAKKKADEAAAALDLSNKVNSHWGVLSPKSTAPPETRIASATWLLQNAPKLTQLDRENLERVRNVSHQKAKRLHTEAQVRKGAADFNAERDRFKEHYEAWKSADEYEKPKHLSAAKESERKLKALLREYPEIAELGGYVIGLDGQRYGAPAKKGKGGAAPALSPADAALMKWIEGKGK